MNESWSAFEKHEYLSGKCSEILRLLYDQGDVRRVRKALALARLTESEITADLEERGERSYVVQAPPWLLDEVTETLKMARGAATRLKSDPEWRMLDAVEGR